MVITTCSATETTFEPVTSATVIPPLVLLAAFKSTWSEPIPAVTAILRFFALANRSAVKYPGWNLIEVQLYRQPRVRLSLRCGDDDFGIDEVLIKLGTFSLFV